MVRILSAPLCAIALLAAAMASHAAGPAEDAPPVFQTKGRHLFDPNGDKVILRGPNAMIVYWDRLGEVTYPEIAKTGANACRIFWTVRAGATPEELDQTLQNCWDNQMIPIICVWDATGKWDMLETCVDYWQRPEIAAVLKKHESHLIVNIANEAGTREVTNEQYREAYAKALAGLRAAGLRMPLMIDAAHWGRGEDYIIENAEYLLEKDPARNVIFSWHPWDTGQPQSRYKEAIGAFADMDICAVIGEFSHLGVEYEKPIDYEYLIRYAHETETGWLAWVWWCCGDEADGHSISKDKIFGNWANDPWGAGIAIEHPFGIRATSVRTPYILNQTSGIE